MPADKSNNQKVKYEDLTDKEKRLIEEFPVDLNATKAAIRAGYSPKSAHVLGPRTLKKVRHLAEARLIEHMEKVGLTVNDVLKALIKIAFLNPKDFCDENGNLLPIQDIPDDAAFALAGFDITKKTYKRRGDDDDTEETTNKYRFVDKKGALELLGKYFAAWTDVQKNKNEGYKSEMTDAELEAIVRGDD